MLYDLSPPIRPGIPVWPGDTEYSHRLTWSLAEGGSVNLSALTSTPHLGSHADAPFHTEVDGAGIGAAPLDAYLGPCRVVAVPPEPLITPEHVEARLEAAGCPGAWPERLLLKTGSVGDRSRFPEDFSALSPELARAAVEHGVRLVGLDTPSVDPFHSKTLDAHHLLFRNGLVNLEGLVLDDVPEGEYELIALPLRLEGLDASPVRALLRSLRREANVTVESDREETT
jgi:arylformamidase